jgi:hypothetical protein
MTLVELGRGSFDRIGNSRIADKAPRVFQRANLSSKFASSITIFQDSARHPGIACKFPVRFSTTDYLGVTAAFEIKDSGIGPTMLRHR